MKIRKFDGTLVEQALRELVQANRELYEGMLASADPKVVQAQLVIELTGGLGRLADLVGKTNRAGRTRGPLKAVAWELADMLHRMCLIAWAFDVDLGREAVEKFNASSAALNAPQRFESFRTGTTDPSAVAAGREGG